MYRGNYITSPPALPVTTNRQDFAFEAELFSDDGTDLDMSDATLVGKLRTDGGSDLPVTMTIETVGNTLSASITAAQMATVSTGTYLFSIVATFASGDVVQLFLGRLSVIQG